MVFLLGRDGGHHDMIEITTSGVILFGRYEGCHDMIEITTLGVILLGMISRGVAIGFLVRSGCWKVTDAVSY